MAKKRKRKRKPCDICGRSHQKVTAKQCIKKMLEAALREAVYKRDEGTCQKCGSQLDFQVSHVYRRSQCGRLAYDLNNVKGLCGTCHLGWWHCNEAEGGIWFAETFPDRWKYISKKIKQYQADPGTISMDWYRTRLEELKTYAQ